MPKVFVGEPAPEELAEIGPDATPSAPDSCVDSERVPGVPADARCPELHGSERFGHRGLSRLAEAYGLLEKRPNTMNVRGEEGAR
ncbi:hypothetical protein [Nonomuraea indica]|uniref:Uncharacterized protein n=1 Tax=Nonomuraea indica TaxID=1581193 RepID=A0ABW7ZYS1_9ACTN